MKPKCLVVQAGFELPDINSSGGVENARLSHSATGYPVAYIYFRLFFCALFQGGQVVKTSGTLSFWANFVEFLTQFAWVLKILVKFFEFWTKTLSFGENIGQNSSVFKQIWPKYVFLGILCPNRFFFLSFFLNLSLSFENLAWKPPGHRVFGPKSPWVLEKLEFFSPWVFRKRTKNAS